MLTREMIINELKSREIEAKPVEVEKNGVIFKGISLGNGPICPTIYTEEFEKYADDELEDAVDVIVYRYNKAKEETPVIDLEKIMNWDYVKTHLQLCIQRKGNENIVKRDFLDLEEYVRVNIDNTGSFKVKPIHLEKYGVTEDVLFHAAWDCTAPSIVIEDMAVMIAEMTGMSIKEVAEMQGDNPMIVATTKEKHFGAIAMKATDKITEVADRYGTDLAILPSSIHEILFIPVREDMNFIELNAMVHAVNINEVAPEEVLSNHAYRFNRDERSITYYHDTKSGKHIL